MIQYIVLSTVILAFILASYEDIKKREVYDYLNFLLTFIILIIGIFHSLLISSLLPIKAVGFGLLVGFAIGSFLYYIGLWGGGDSKFLLGFSAASFYLIEFSKSESFMHLVYERIMENFSIILIPFLNFFIEIVLVLDYIALVVLLGFLIFTKRNIQKYQLFAILALLTYGLYTVPNEFELVLIGFISFLLIFFSKEDMFSQIKYIPLSSLVSINFLCFVLLIITLSPLNLEILSFLLKFIFFSFIIGGILGVLIILFFTIKNFRKIKFNFSKLKKNILISSTILSLLLSIFNVDFLLLLLLIFLFIFVKISKQIEKIIFISKKPINKIVPGDWIVEDIIINKKKIFSKEDFKLGVNEEQLKKIQKLSKENKNFKNILVKDGIAFIPPLFFAFLILILF